MSTKCTIAYSNNKPDFHLYYDYADDNTHLEWILRDEDGGRQTWHTLVPKEFVDSVIASVNPKFLQSGYKPPKKVEKR